MGVKAWLARAAAAYIAPQVYRQHRNAALMQERMFQYLLENGRATRFGKDHDFHHISSVQDFQQAVPVRDYEQIKHYIEAIANGKEHVLWPGKPLYFCKSSGTTSGTKYIPVTEPQISAMVHAARNALLMYVHETGNAAFFDYKMIFLQGSPVLDVHGVIPSGRLSGIVYHHVPFYVNANRMPGYQTNCIEDWEQKVDAIARETVNEKMSLISGIPPWCVMYFEKLKEISGKKHIKDIFPEFSVFVYGGVNYEPYRQQMESLIGKRIDSIETYPASEGFIAYQDSQQQPGLLLNLDAGIFYEFIRTEEYFNKNPRRYTLAEVELNVQYAIVLTTNAGLWAYSIGDTIKFVSLNPYRVVVTGRIKHFISAFGEHVIAEEVEQALLFAMRELDTGVTEFTVAPQVNPTTGLPYHEWFIEFSKLPHSLIDFAFHIDGCLQERNTYYADLRQGNILQQLKITRLRPGAFVDYMKTQGKLGGQNKVPRLTNDRAIADRLSEYVIHE